jgi:hypothetical protein
MDLSQLIKDIASSAAPRQPEPVDSLRQQVVATPPEEPLPSAPRLQFESLEQMAALDAPAAALILDAAQPDDVVVTLAANQDEDLRRWLLAPLDQESRHWVVDNAMQLGQPTAALAAAAARRLLATANRLAAEGAITEADCGPDAPPARAESDPDHLTPARGNPVLAPERPELHVSSHVSFAVGGNPATAQAALSDPPPKSRTQAPRTTQSTATTQERCQARPAQPEAANEDLHELRQHLAHLIGLSRRHGQEAVAALAAEAPHPLLQAGLHLLTRPISRNDLDQVMLDLQAQAERSYTAQCDLIRSAIDAIHGGTKAEDFLAGS